MQDKYIEEYLSQSKKTQELEYYIEMEGGESNCSLELSNSFVESFEEQARIWNEYGLTRQMLTDYHDKKRGAVKCNSVSEALNAMHAAFG